MSVTCDRSVVFSLGTAVPSANKTDRHNITEILLKVALNTIKQINKQTSSYILENSHSCILQHQIRGELYWFTHVVMHCSLVSVTVQWSCICSLVSVTVQWSCICSLVSVTVQWSSICSLVSVTVQWSCIIHWCLRLLS